MIKETDKILSPEDITTDTGKFPWGCIYSFREFLNRYHAMRHPTFGRPLFSEDEHLFDHDTRKLCWIVHGGRLHSGNQAGLVDKNRKLLYLYSGEFRVAQIKDTSNEMRTL